MHMGVFNAINSHREDQKSIVLNFKQPAGNIYSVGLNLTPAVAHGYNKSKSEHSSSLHRHHLHHKCFAERVLFIKISYIIAEVSTWLS